MYQVLVQTPFYFTDEKRDCEPGEVMVVSEAVLERMREVNPNLVAVLGAVEQAEPASEVIPEPVEVPEILDVPEEKVTKRKKA